MAMTDYFYPCRKLESRVVSDGLGGFETVEYVGVEFEGLAVKRSSTEQLIGSLRGQENTQYVFHTYANVPLNKDDKIEYTEKGVKRYVRLTSTAQVNTDQSTQTDWVSYNAESYTPTTIINE